MFTNLKEFFFHWRKGAKKSGQQSNKKKIDSQKFQNVKKLPKNQNAEKWHNLNSKVSEIPQKNYIAKRDWKRQQKLRK